MTNPGWPAAIAVMVDGQTVAFVEIDEFKRVAKRLDELEKMFEASLGNR
jgi:tetrahydromethanopterin S-methyltransferase subunit G